MSGCYPGCYYYSDSCFRKDCKTMTNENNWGTLPNVIKEPSTARGCADHRIVVPLGEGGKGSGSMFMDMTAIRQIGIHSVEMLAADETSADDGWDV